MEMGSISVFSKISSLLKELRRCLPNIQFHEITSGQDSKLRESEIIIGDFDLLAPVLYDLPKAKWIQGTWAGVDKISTHIKQDKQLPFIITRYSGKHFGRMMGEYVLSHVVNRERDFLKMYNNQNSQTWSAEGKIGDYRVISDLNVGVMGLGQIGSWIAEIFHKFGATIFGFGRKPNLAENLKDVVMDYYTHSNLADFLKKCDYVVNTLPNTNETKDLLNASVLENCKGRGTVFINIGRGSIISDDELVEALNKEWLAGAILDVFNIEPLPQSSLLWSMPQVIITPHVSAVSMGRHIAEQFRDNLELYKNNKRIPTVLDISKGY